MLPGWSQVRSLLSQLKEMLEGSVLENGEIGRRFGYHPPQDEATVGAHEQTRATAADLAFELDELLPECREKSLAITKVEEAMFWANAAIARA